MNGMQSNGSSVSQRAEQSFGVCFPFVWNKLSKIFMIERPVFLPVKNLFSSLGQLRRYLEYILVKLFIFSRVQMALLS